jgi:hypothetical protein
MPAHAHPTELLLASCTESQVIIMIYPMILLTGGGSSTAVDQAAADAQALSFRMQPLLSVGCLQ